MVLCKADLKNGSIKGTSKNSDFAALAKNSKASSVFLEEKILAEICH